MTTGSGYLWGRALCGSETCPSAYLSFARLVCETKPADKTSVACGESETLTQSPHVSPPPIPFLLSSSGAAPPQLSSRRLGLPRLLDPAPAPAPRWSLPPPASSSSPSLHRLAVFTADGTRPWMTSRPGGLGGDLGLGSASFGQRPGRPRAARRTATRTAARTAATAGIRLDGGQDGR